MRRLLLGICLALWASCAAADTVCTGAIEAGPWTSCITQGTEAGHLKVASEGGLVRIAAYQALGIALHQVRLDVVGPCWSACIWLLAASPKPHLGPQASVSVHFIHSYLGDNRVLVRAHETRAAWRMLTGRDDLWNAYVAYVRRQHVVPAGWDGGDFTTYATTKGGSFAQMSFLTLGTERLHQLGLLSGRDPRLDPEQGPL
jgi:hypothetical protein